MKIKLNYDSNGSFIGWHFSLEGVDDRYVEERRCDICENYLYTGYTMIINKLEEAGILSEDHEDLCCECKLDY